MSRLHPKPFLKYWKRYLAISSVKSNTNIEEDKNKYFTV